ncbi:hypothetical protein MKZ38_001913 [Zalerion maritima]|uniref:Uncharacterized protein n=1 Tax=Zalerion maritima TaxID=339359 RepID=A0AAD5RPJ8_9PEZI|nr:hypothetical protein MKZ38_001913 [Zalerion maritima]
MPGASDLDTVGERPSLLYCRFRRNHMPTSSKDTPPTPPTTPPTMAPTGLLSSSSPVPGAAVSITPGPVTSDVKSPPESPPELAVSSPDALDADDSSAEEVEEVVDSDEDPDGDDDESSLGSSVAVARSGSHLVPLSLPPHTTLETVAPSEVITKLSQYALESSEQHVVLAPTPSQPVLPPSTKFMHAVGMGPSQPAESVPSQQRNHVPIGVHVRSAALQVMAASETFVLSVWLNGTGS